MSRRKTQEQLQSWSATHRGRHGLIALIASMVALAAGAEAPLTTAAVMESLEAGDWRQPDQENLFYLRLPDGVVIIELAPETAPKTIANIKKLAQDKYFDGLAIIRSHDNYVAQWGDPAETVAEQRSIGEAKQTIETEFDVASDSVTMIAVDSRDPYADSVGFVDGFPAASDGNRTWLAHCYGMLGVARGMQPDSGNGTSLYVVTGHAPRHLDRNLTVAGRVVVGIEHLSSLPRGTGPLGFYETAAERTLIVDARMGSDIPATDQVKIDILRADTVAFSRYVESRTHRNEEFFVHPTGRIELCNINPPIRVNSP